MKILAFLKVVGVCPLFAKYNFMVLIKCKFFVRTLSSYYANNSRYNHVVVHKYPKTAILFRRTNATTKGSSSLRFPK